MGVGSRGGAGREPVLRRAVWAWIVLLELSRLAVWWVGVGEGCG